MVWHRTGKSDGSHRDFAGCVLKREDDSELAYSLDKVLCIDRGPQETGIQSPAPTGIRQGQRGRPTKVYPFSNLGQI